MSKRKKQKSKQRVKTKNKRPSSSPFGWLRSPQANPALVAMEAGTLIEAGKVEEALDLVEPLLDEYPRSVELWGTAAVAYMLLGALWEAIDCFEQVQKFGATPELLATSASLYIQAGMHTHAMQAARNALKGMQDADDRADLQLLLTPIEQEFKNLVQTLGLPASQVERGLLHHDESQRAMGQSDFQAAINASRSAIRFLGNWPPPHNNLALSLFYNGQPAEALATIQNVLTHDPNNLHALSNAIKFLAWSGKTSEARTLWERLRSLEAKNERERIKQAEGAAIMEEDALVYDLLKPLVEGGAQEDMSLDWLVTYRFIAAEANTGRTKSALKRLKELDVADPRLTSIYESLKANRPGAGWSTRYPYFTIPELMPVPKLEEFAFLIAEEEELDQDQFRKQVNGYIKQFPQLLLVAQKLIWEDQQVELGVNLLSILATPEAYALLRDFGFSQMGDDEDRTRALIFLKEAGEIDASQPVKMWSEGEWREIKLVTYEISNEPEVVYPPAVLNIYERAINAFNSENYAEAERLYKQVIALEPRAADAYFNLGSSYAAQGNIDQAKEMYHKSIELRPLYALPRCQLAHFLLNDGDIEEAKKMLLPIADATRLNEIEAKMYMYTQARILVRVEEYEKAEALLESSLEIDPDFAPAQELLDQTSMLAIFGAGFKRRLEEMSRRHGSKRSAMQTKFKTADVTVDMALGLFNREIQLNMARHILLSGDGYKLKKKELHERLALEVPERETLKHILNSLSKEERAALHDVIEHGGFMAWDEFAESYDDDLDESPAWQYHEPTTIMGRLRQRVLLTEASVNNQLLVVVPVELRKPLAELL